MDRYQIRLLNNKEKLKDLVERGVGNKTMALLCGISKKSLEKRLIEYGINKKVLFNLSKRS